jgi:hypothetical protein
LSGIWHNCNSSLDLVTLHREIRDLINAPPLSIDIARDAQNFLSALSKQFPSFGRILYNWIGFGVFVILLLLCIPCITRLFIKQIGGLYIDLKKKKKT